MIEKEIEDIVSSKIQSCIDELGYSIQIMRAWTGDAVEQTKDGYIAIKVLPRRYETPTIPTAQITVSIAFTYRAETDMDRSNYLMTTSKIADLIQSYQDDIAKVTDELSFDGFDCVGFQIDSGDCGNDPSRKTWIYSTSFILYGVI